MVNLIDFIGRLFISSVFLLSGYNKLMNFEATVNWMEGFGVPGFLLWPTIILEILLPIFIIIGYVMMSGGGSNDPDIFNYEIYNFRRIKVAPLLVIIGLAIQVYAILNSDKKQ